MRRPVACLFIAFAALASGSCDSPTFVKVDVGPVVAVDSLRAGDGTLVPCCAVDSAGERVSIVGGALVFRRDLHYTDTVYSPGGPISAACLNEVPNGATIHPNYLVTVGDTLAYLVIPCHVGTYALSLTQRLDAAGGSSRTAAVTVSSGTYSWSRDTLSLVAGAGETLMATMVADTVIVSAPMHTYQLQAVAPPPN